MSETPRVLLIEDQVGDIEWLVDLIKARGYEIDLATNRMAARQRLDAIKDGRASYALAIIDIMIATEDIERLTELNEESFGDAKRAGIDLCRYARETLRISASTLPIICLSVLQDDATKNSLEELGIVLYPRSSPQRATPLRIFLASNLRDVSRDWEEERS